eukprot:scaffold16521_cov101-Isochrysis_galbana.AAC.1
MKGNASITGWENTSPPRPASGRLEFKAEQGLTCFASPCRQRPSETHRLKRVRASLASPGSAAPTHGTRPPCRGSGRRAQPPPRRPGPRAKAAPVPRPRDSAAAAASGSASSYRPSSMSATSLAWRAEASDGSRASTRSHAPSTGTSASSRPARASSTSEASSDSRASMARARPMS